MPCCRFCPFGTWSSLLLMLHVLPFVRDPKDPNDLVDPKAPEAATRNKKNIPSCMAKGNVL